MVLYLGQNVAVPKRDVLFILSYEMMEKGNRIFLRRMEQEGNLIRLDNKNAQSVVLTYEKGSTRLYLSELSAQTLKKRMESPVT